MPFLFPNAFMSVFTGYLYSQGHLTRAICCRVARDGNVLQEKLQAPYHINHPEVVRAWHLFVLLSPPFTSALGFGPHQGALQGGHLAEALQPRSGG